VSSCDVDTTDMGGLGSGAGGLGAVGIVCGAGSDFINGGGPGRVTLEVDMGFSPSNSFT
jgi:hypothetical protein